MTMGLTRRRLAKVLDRVGVRQHAPMVYARLSNGFGNNLFQYIAARLLAEQADLPLGVVAPLELLRAR